MYLTGLIQVEDVKEIFTRLHYKVAISKHHSKRLDAIKKSNWQSNKST